MKKIQDFVLKNAWLLIAPAIMTVIIVIVYAIKGIYPFGYRTISYFDMGQSVVPAYYHTYDVLHGNASLFLNWNVSLGTSMGDLFGNYVLFPTNIFFFFVSRENILNAMSFFLIIKIILASFFMSIYSFSKCENRALSVFTSLLYSACGFVIQYYTSIYFLDVFLIFPLLIYAYDELVEKNKRWLYILCLTLVFICNVQMMFFVSLYILLKTGLNIIRMNAKDRGVVVCRVFFCSVCAILCSAVSFIPMAVQTMKSARVSADANHGFFVAVQTIICEDQQQKNFMLYGAEFVIPLILFLVISRKWKKYISTILMILLLLVPLVFEGVNLMWHLGTYQLFPMRFGFILSFECLNLLVISYEEVKNYTFRFGRYLALASVCIIPAFALVLFRFVKYFHIYGIRDLQIYSSYWLIVLLVGIIYAGIFFCGTKNYIQVLIGLMAVIQSALGYYGFLGVEMSYYPECESDNVIYYSEKLRTEADELNKLYDRTKDLNFYLNANYPFISQTSSASGWMNGSSYQLVQELIRMGYNQFYVRTLDCGGTALTDSLLGYKYTVNHMPDYNPDLYKIEKGKDILYKNLYYLPFGYFVNDSFNADTIGFDHQNQLYHTLLETEEDLFTVVSFEDAETIFDEETEEYHTYIDLDIPEKSILYIFGNGLAPLFSDEIYQIIVNDKVILNPYLYDEGNTYFPITYRNGFLETGTYEGEVKLEIIGWEDTFTSSGYMEIGYLPISKLSEFVDQKSQEYQIDSFEVTNSKLTMEIDANRSGEFVIPIAYSDNWKVKLNGEEINPMSEIDDTFIALNLFRGKNTITIQYVQKGLVLGVILTIIGIGLSILMVKKDFCNFKVLNAGLVILFWVVFAAFLLYIYINPVSSNLLMMIKTHTSIKDILTYF